MAAVVTLSKTPQVLDTLPALKTRWYTGGEAIYTLARFGFFAGGLQLSLSAFERTPDADSRIGFALCGGAGPVALLCTGPEGGELVYYDRAAPPQLGQPPGTAPLPCPAQPGAGADEQGWYWEMRFTLGAEVLGHVGICPAEGATLQAALLKWRQGEKGYGASHPVPDTENPLAPRLFEHFTVVGY